MALKSRLPQVARALDVACNESARQAAERLLAARNQRVPVDTGQLRDSGKIEQVADGVWRFSEGEGLPDARALYTEYGTVKQAAQPHVWPAVEEARTEMPDVVISSVRRAIG